MRKLVTVLILLVLVGGGAYYYFVASVEEEEPQVVLQTIARGDVVEAVQATGTLEPLRTVDVGAQVSGIVQNLYADFNSIVTRGQLIAELDPTLLQVQVNLQEANVARQEGEIANQEVQLENSRKQLERTQALFDRELATQQELDQAILNLRQRETALDAANKQLLTTQANLDQARLNVSYTKIYAPVDGVVVSRLVDIGQAVQSSMSTPQFFQIATDLRQLRLTAGVDEAEIGKIRPGMEVSFQVDTYPQRTFSGIVEQVRLDATVQSNVVTYPVWIEVPNPGLLLYPAMTASLRIIVQTAENVIRVPNQATRFRPTNDMYTALGLTPPAQSGGRVVQTATEGRAASAGDTAAARGNQGDTLAEIARARGTAAAPAAAAAEAPQQASRGNGGQVGRGGDATGQARPSGRGGGRGGRGRNGGAAQAPVAPVAPVDLMASAKIDELYAPVEKRIQRLQVWDWNPETSELTSHSIEIGITDGQFSEVVSGDLDVGDQVVTNIILPVTAVERQETLFNSRGGFGGGRGGRGR